MLKIAWSPIYAHPLPKGHRFPMIKYELLPQQYYTKALLPKLIYSSPIRCLKNILSTRTALFTGKN